MIIAAAGIARNRVAANMVALGQGVTAALRPAILVGGSSVAGTVKMRTVARVIHGNRRLGKPDVYGVE